jgi:DhnA family fructose-bisphosphate aldolase class Ia
MAVQQCTTIATTTLVFASSSEERERARSTNDRPPADVGADDVKVLRSNLSFARARAGAPRPVVVGGGPSVKARIRYVARARRRTRLT